VPTMNHRDIIKNPAYFALLLFTGLFLIFMYGAPHLLFEEDGSIRQFGLGFRKKTIVPIWMVSIILAILCYLFVQFYCLKPMM
jgi:uncharacterized membrane protein YozB (DUF420 family)